MLLNDRTKKLAEFSRRMAIGVQSGVDLRKTLEREAERAHGTWATVLKRLAQQAGAGQSLADAMEQAGHHFPPFYIQMVRLGEETGQLDRTLLRLAGYYDQLRILKGVLIVGTLWPVLQLVIALVVLAVFILALGWVSSMTGQTVDVLGFGLVGTVGLIRYLSFLATLGLIAFAIRRLARSEPMRPRFASCCIVFQCWAVPCGRRLFRDWHGLSRWPMTPARVRQRLFA